jgi:Fic family protein
MDANYSNPATKEVQNYVEALLTGYKEVKEHNLLTNRTILAIQKALEKNNAGFRKLPGTSLKNQTGQIIYEPPQDPQQIIDLMSNFEAYINGSLDEDLDPLIKMAIIHFQFESIHPFYDGNGRTGRIINILYLVKEGLQTSLYYT